MAAPILYHCPRTRSETAFWLNEELGDVCDIQLINVFKGEQKTADFLALNPMGKLPTLVHDGAVTSESAAVCVYLADRFAEKGLAPALDNANRGPYLRWIFFSPSCIEPAMADIFAKRTNSNPGSSGYGDADMAFGAAATAIKEREYILGDAFSAADVVFGSTLNFAMMFGAIPREGPFAAYVDRLLARPAAVRAREKSQEIKAQMDAA